MADELPYILNDEEYAMKYRAELKAAVFKAKANPGAFLRGYNVCIATHVQPPARTLSAIVKSAGGDVSWKLWLQNIFLVAKTILSCISYLLFRQILISSNSYLVPCPCPLPYD